MRERERERERDEYNCEMGKLKEITQIRKKRSIEN
jgi:hypothetical protein